MDDLKPCPFCGGEVGFHGSAVDPECSGCHYVSCDNCGLMADFGGKADPNNDSETREELCARIVPLWNRRPEPSGDSHG